MRDRNDEKTLGMRISMRHPWLRTPHEPPRRRYSRRLIGFSYLAFLALHMFFDFLKKSTVKSISLSQKNVFKYGVICDAYILDTFQSFGGSSTETDDIISNSH
jgi:hypothetical protein